MSEVCIYMYIHVPSIKLVWIETFSQPIMTMWFIFYYTHISTSSQSSLIPEFVLYISVLQCACVLLGQRQRERKVTLVVRVKASVAVLSFAADWPLCSSRRGARYRQPCLLNRSSKKRRASLVTWWILRKLRSRFGNLGAKVGEFLCL